MKHPLKRVIDDLTFENRHKYSIELDFLNFSESYFYLRVIRGALCSIRKEPIKIHNNSVVPRTCTEDQLVKIIFEKVGQFEAHEFCESFKYKGMFAFFPHDTYQDRNLPYLYAKSNRINDLLLEPWNDIAQERNDFDIAKRHLKLWWNETQIVKAGQLVALRYRQFKALPKEIHWQLTKLKRRIVKAITAFFKPKPAPYLTDYSGLFIEFTINIETGVVTHHNPPQDKKAA